MRKLYLLVFFSVTFFWAKAQTLSESDSLALLLNKVSGKEKLDVLLSLSHFKSGEYSRAEECASYAKQAKILAKQLDDQSKYVLALIREGEAISAFAMRSKGIDTLKRAVRLATELKNDTILAGAYQALGMEQVANDDLKSSLQSYEKSLALSKDLKDTIRLSSTINNLASANFHLGNLAKALQLYQEAIAIKQTINNPSGLPKAYSNIALVYKNIGNYEKALEYSLKSVPILKAKNDIFSLSISYLSIGNIYRKVNKYDSSVYYNEMALELSESIQDSVGIAYAYYNLGSSYYSKKELQHSESYYLKALELFESANSKANVIATCTSLSNIYQNTNKLDKATTVILKALELANELEIKSTYKNLVETLYTLYKMKGDYKTALGYHEQYFAYTDSLLNSQKMKEIALLETNFEVTQRDNEINLLNKVQEFNELELKQANKTRVFFIISLFLLLIILVITYRSYRLKNASEKKLSQKNEQLNELNAAKDKFFAIIAHDLRNPLSAFKSLSTALVENFSQMSEKDLSHYLQSLKHSSEELINLLHNLLQWALSQTKTLKPDPQVLSLNNLLTKNINFLQEAAGQKDIKINTNLSDNSNAFVDGPTIDLVFRNVISNAIKFTESGGAITITTTLLEDKVKVVIEDTGIGMTESDAQKLFNIIEDTSTIGESKEKGTGLGLILCKEFVDKNRGQILVDSKLGEGSRFDIILPVNDFKDAA